MNEENYPVSGPTEHSASPAANAVGEKRIRVMLVDDHAVVRAGLASLIRREGCFDVVGEAGGTAEATRVCAEVLPEIAILDIRMPDGDGLTLCASLKAAHPGLKVVILTSYGDVGYQLNAFQAGADGYVIKTINTTTLIECLRKVAAGGRFVTPAASPEVDDDVDRGDEDSRQYRDGQESLKFSRQEVEILERLALGRLSKEIADELGMAEKTVRNLLTRIYRTLRVENRIQAVRKWMVIRQ